MNIHERLEAFWAGEKPDRIPYTIYQWEWKDYKDDHVWQPLLKDGLGITYHVPSVNEISSNVEYISQPYTENGKQYVRKTMKTPVGEIYSIESEGWCQRHWMDSAEDYMVMKYIVENTDMVPCYDQFIAKGKEIEPYGVPLIQLGRTPMQVILVDYVGLENFSYHLVDFEDEMMELYGALLKNYRRKVELVAAGPGRFVSALENFTAETMGPIRFERFNMPVYHELFPELQRTGKIVGTHYDGKLSSCKDLIAKAPINLIESLTESPEGDMVMCQYRSAWPDKLFWCNINVSTYNLPEKELIEQVHRLVKEGAPDGRKLAFEVSEHIPKNWRESMPILLRTLNEIVL